jgi:phage baseplate assembly protein W
MPIVNSIRRINPLDLNKNVKIGVAFPLDETNLFSGTETVREQIKSNLLNILLTYPGERVNLPNFGVGLKNLLFEQSIDIEQLKEIIQNQINEFLPTVKLKGISIQESEDKHTISIKLTYIYILDGPSQEDETIQINFN